MSLPRTILAYHEAGHAVTAWSLGAAVRGVSIIPSRDSAGQCPHAALIQGKYPETEKNLTILFGGMIAECRSNPHTTQGYHGHQEYKMAVESALRFCEGQQEEARAFLKWLEIRSRNILRKDWPLVEMLAMELLARDTIEGKIVERLLATAAR